MPHAQPSLEAPPEAGERPAGPPHSRATTIALVLLLALACGWILRLPVFPSQDGPVHVYYATVTNSLLSGAPTFRDGFRLAHLLPPYCLHFYLLMGLILVMGGAMAEKVLACLCVLIAAGGFLYFARQLGRGAALVALFATPFFLHRYLFFGFYGYALGLGLALTAMGIWIRPDRSRLPRRAAFLALALITSFSHPMPYAFLLAYCASEMLAGRALSKLPRGHLPSPLVRPRVSDLLALLVAVCPMFYIAAYAGSGSLWASYARGELAPNPFRILALLQMGNVLPLWATGYQAALRVIFLFLLTLGIWQAWRDLAARRATRAQLALAWGLLALLSLPFLPDEFNGLYLLADRTAVWSVLLLMASASAVELDHRVTKFAIVLACAATVYSLAVLNAYMGPIARQTDVAHRAASSPSGAHVLLVNIYDPPRDLTYDPYVMAGVRLVEQDKAVLVQSPFLDLPARMLRPTEAEENQDRLAAAPLRLLQDLGPQGMIVVTRCSVSGRSVRPLPSWLRQTYAGQWKVSPYSCFDLLRPAVFRPQDAR